LFDMSKNSTVLNTEKVNGRPRVVIVGGGFGGLWAARALADVPVEVLVVDRNNYHTFLPLLYQVAAAELEPSQIGYPIRTILRGVHNADFVMGEVTAVDPEARQVQTKAALIDYDYLILATGSIPQFFGIPGAEAHTFPMKTMEDGIRLRNHILRIFEEAERETDPVRRRRLLTFVTIGGGPSGVEFAGALAELIHGPLAKDYPTIDLNEVRVVLVEAASNLLNTMPERLGRYTAELLESKQVEVRLASIVSEVTRHAVYLRDGSEIFTETAVWTAGVGGQNIAQRSGLPTRRNGTVEVEPTLQIPGYPNVYVIGDLAAFKTADGYLPMVAPVAMQQGAHTAQNIGRQIKGEALRPFTYTDKGSMAVIGRNAAVANIAGRAFTGFLAWLIWIVVHVAQLIGFRNRIMVLINWAWNYILYERVVRLILASEMPPAAPRDLEKEEEGHVVRI
jgi:NADH:ubiquinone reductase (H+-translocating)